MARIRTIKPEFWTSSTVVELDPFARLLFIGSWNFADDHGLLPDDPKRLKLQVLPADPVDAAELVEVLVDAGLFERVTAPTGERLLRIVTFGSHQKIDKRSSGKWGNPDEWPTQSPRIPPSPAESPQHPPFSTPGMEGNGSSRDTSEMQRDSARHDPDEEALVDQVIAGVARARLKATQANTKVARPAAWLNVTTKSIRDDPDYMNEVQRVCSKWPSAPVGMLVQAAEGDISPNLRNYEAVAS
jgi:hypothetical protein